MMKTLHDVKKTHEWLNSLDLKAKKREEIISNREEKTSSPVTVSISVHEDKKYQSLLQKSYTIIEDWWGFIQSLTMREVVCIAFLVGVLAMLEDVSVKFLVFIKFDKFIYRTVASFVVVYAFDFLCGYLCRIFNKFEHDEIRNSKLLIFTYLFYGLNNVGYAYYSQNYVMLNLGVIYMAICKIVQQKKN